MEDCLLANEPSRVFKERSSLSSIQRAVCWVFWCAIHLAPVSQISSAQRAHDDMNGAARPPMGGWRHFLIPRGAGAEGFSASPLHQNPRKWCGSCEWGQGINGMGPWAPCHGLPDTVGGKFERRHSVELNLTKWNQHKLFAVRDDCAQHGPLCNPGSELRHFLFFGTNILDSLCSLTC